MYEPKNDDEFLGSYQSGIVDALADGDKTLLYVDQSAKMSVSSAMEEYFYGNPNVLSEEYASEDSRSYCGSYVYRLWNSESKDCYPDYSNSQTFELNSLIDKHLTALTYLQSNAKKPIYLDSVLKQTINYEYKYVANTAYTTIYGYTNDKYTIDIFKNASIKNDPNINQYLQTKSTYSGDLIWPLPNYYYVSSCFGYRGAITTPSGVNGSANHPGIDIPAPIDTPVVAAAGGTVTEILKDTWGKVVIDHGGGLETDYLHMNKIADGLTVGDIVTQGQIIGYVGGRGANSATDYPYHLHFDVISENVDPNTKYKDVSGIVTGTTGLHYVNPLCFINTNVGSTSGTPGLSTSGTSGEKISFDMTSKACNSVCDSPKNCANVNANDIAGGTPYKFCDIYQGVVAKDFPCPKSDKADWEINNVELSSTSLTSDQTLTITYSIINKGDVCVAIYAKPRITTWGHDYTIDTKTSTNVYKTDDKKTPTNLNTLTCTFSSDSNVIAKAQADGKCVLWTPDDNTTATYTIQPKDLFMDYNNQKKDYTGPELHFTVKKGVVANTNKNVPSATITLTSSEQATIDKTRTNLEGEGAMPYIDAASVKYNIPKEILLGKITLESTGINYKINLPTNRAIGVSQVEGWQHYNTIQSVCGNDYVSECNRCGKTANDFKDCCTFTKFGSDISCQINVGADILKQFYDIYNNNDDVYSKAVLASCKNPDYQTKYLAYTGWERALRAYNGFGCADLNSPYVEKVMRYAAGWGYAGAYTAMIQNDANQGIFGTYEIKPVFNIKIGFDMRLFDLLQTFSKNAVVKCGVEGEDKKVCLQKQVDAFNLGLSSDYTTKVFLSMNCDDNEKTIDVNKVVEDINDCVTSSDNECNCFILPPSSTRIDDIESTDTSTIFTYDDGFGTKTAYLDYSIAKGDSPWQEKRVSTDSINIYKDKNGQLNVGTTGVQKCNPAKNKFRFCLRTNYTYTIYDSTTSDANKILTKSVIIPFALLIRDQIAPSPVSNFDSYNLQHARNDIVLRWDKNKEPDVLKYNLYLSNDKSVFDRSIPILKQTIISISVSSDPKHYLTYKSIDLNNPTCKLQSTTDSSNSNTIDYCIFEYTAVDTNDKTIQIELKPNQPYYVSQLNKFIYILNGSDTSLGLSSGKEKFVAITAVDIDGNEIDNQKDGQKIELEKNLISVTPENRLEVGLTKIISATLTDQNKGVTLSWNGVKNYIDGTVIDSSANIKYSVLMSQMDSCPEGLYQFSFLSGGKSQDYTTTEGNLDISGVSSGNYCLAVSASTTDVPGFDQVFLKSLNIPNAQTPP